MAEKTMGSLVCHRCGKNAQEIGGYLGRVNKGKVPSIWECRPNCSADLPQDTRLLLALEEPATPAPPKEPTK